MAASAWLDINLKRNRKLKKQKDWHKCLPWHPYPICISLGPLISINVDKNYTIQNIIHMYAKAMRTPQNELSTQVLWDQLLSLKPSKTLEYYKIGPEDILIWEPQLDSKKILLNDPKLNLCDMCYNQDSAWICKWGSHQSSLWNDWIQLHIMNHKSLSHFIQPINSTVTEQDGIIDISYNGTNTNCEQIEYLADFIMRIKTLYLMKMNIKLKDFIDFRSGKQIKNLRKQYETMKNGLSQIVRDLDQKGSTFSKMTMKNLMLNNFSKKFVNKSIRCKLKIQNTVQQTLQEIDELYNLNTTVQMENILQGDYSDIKIILNPGDKVDAIPFHKANNKRIIEILLMQRSGVQGVQERADELSSEYLQDLAQYEFEQTISGQAKQQKYWDVEEIPTYHPEAVDLMNKYFKEVDEFTPNQCQKILQGFIKEIDPQAYRTIYSRKHMQHTKPSSTEIRVPVLDNINNDSAQHIFKMKKKIGADLFLISSLSSIQEMDNLNSIIHAVDDYGVTLHADIFACTFDQLWR